MLQRSIATDKMICDLCSQFMGAKVAPNLAVFELMLAENPDCGLPVRSVEQQRQDLIEDICKLLRNPAGDARGGKYSDTDLQTYRNNVLSQSTKQWLEQRKAGIIEAQRMAKLTPEALRAEERAKRTTFVATHLPPEITAEQLKNSLPLLRFWIRAKGAKAVNDRLAGRG